MLNFQKLLLIACVSLFSVGYIAPLRAEAEVKENLEAKVEEKNESGLPQISEAFGHLIGKNLSTLGFDFDMTQVIKGIEDSLAGKDSPMNETECIQAISLIQENAMKKLGEKNLQLANEFLAKQKNESGVVELEEGKLAYKVEKEGQGAVVEQHNSPLIRYTGRFLDGKVFGSSQDSEMISLDETIAGFSRGIVGMKEGEKRTLYIHPELGYGTSGVLPPNSLLAFEIEVVKSHVAKEDKTTLSAVESEAESLEIAAETPEEEAIR